MFLQNMSIENEWCEMMVMMIAVWCQWCQCTLVDHRVATTTTTYLLIVVVRFSWLLCLMTPSLSRSVAGWFVALCGEWTLGVRFGGFTSRVFRSASNSQHDTKSGQTEIPTPSGAGSLRQKTRALEARSHSSLNPTVAYRKAINAIQRYPTRIKNGEEALKIHGIGKRIPDKIETLVVPTRQH